MDSTNEEILNESGTYDMVPAHGEYAGLCLIFNITTFAADCLPTRNGSAKDVERITAVFGNRFGFKVEELKDYSKDQMEAHLSEVSQTFNTKWRSFVCFVLSHGLGEDYLADSEGEEVNVRDLTEVLDGKNSPKLNGKPKLFFFQMCRGFDREEYYRSQQGYDAVTETIDIGEENKNKNISTQRDRLVCFATTPGRMARIYEDKGSLFIQTLTQVLEEKGDHVGITKILQEVTRRVDGKSEEEYKVCPVYDSTLAYDLTFPLRVQSPKVADGQKRIPAGVPRTAAAMSMASVIGQLTKTNINKEN